MKNCPLCKAEIEDNARFCLYCMTSLDEKKVFKNKNNKSKRWLIVIAALLLLTLIGSGIWFAVPQNDNGGVVDETKPKTETTVTDTASNIASSAIGNDTNSTDNITTDNLTGEIINQHSNNNDVNDSSNSNGNNTQTAEKPESNVNSSSDNTNSNSGSTEASNNNAQETEAPTINEVETEYIPPVTSKPTQTSITYTYRQAEYGDDFSVSYPITENDIVITGVNTVSPNGEYIIPSEIDGKNVIAVMGLTFSDSNISSSVKKVVVPSSVKTIWNYAFANCYNLTDIYFCGDRIYTETQAFPDPSDRNNTLTIHCSASCSDRNLRYYKNSASYYGAVYKEWNGGEYN